jgi:hypothetical protein
MAATSKDDLAPWLALYETFHILANSSREIPPPSVTDLDEYESLSGLLLPAGYRGFIRVFGAGELEVPAGVIRIYAPSCPNKHADLGTRAREAKPASWQKPTERYSRTHFFGSSFDGDQFGWDPETVTDPAAPEYAVVGWIRGRSDVVPLADTFAGFIELCQGHEEFRRRMGYTSVEEELAEMGSDLDDEDTEGLPGFDPAVRKFQRTRR